MCPRAADTAENLLRNHRAAGSMRIEAKVNEDNAKVILAQIPGVKDVSEEKDADGYSIFHLRLEANADPAEQVMRLAADKHWKVRELARRRATLEDVFVELTHTDS